MNRRTMMAIQKAESVNFVSELISDGTQRIGTGFSPTRVGNYKFRVDFRPTRANKTEIYFSNLVNNNVMAGPQLVHVGVAQDKIRIDPIAESQYVQTSVIGNHSWVENSGDVNFDSSPIGSIATVYRSDLANELTLFGKSSETSTLAACGISYVLYEQDGVKLLELKPALDKSNVPCMYDTVSKQYLYSSFGNPFTYQ